MATNHGNNSIITNGLHYYMDPANKQSYIGSGTSAGSTVGTVPMGTLGASNVFSSDNGGIFNFDGASDYLQVASNGSTTGFNSDNYTICAWCKPTNTGQTYYDTIFSYDYIVHSPPYYAIHFRGFPTNSPSTSNRGKLILAYNAGGSWLGYDSLFLAGDTSTFVSTSWNMYSVTFERSGGDNIVKLYKNGTLLGSQTKTQAAPTYYNQEVYLGKSNFATGQYDGGYGPLMFYNKVLSLDEITQNYNALKERFGL